MDRWVSKWFAAVLMIVCVFFEASCKEEKLSEVLHFSQLIDQYDAFLLDAYGVFWESNETGVVPGAAEAMSTLVKKGKKVGILSNSTMLVQKEKEKVASRGIYEGIHYHFFLTSGQVTRELLLSEQLPFKTPRKTFWIFSAPHPRFPMQLSLFEGTSYRQVDEITEADFVYISIPHVEGIDQVDLEVFRKSVADCASRNIPVLCANPDFGGCEGGQLFIRQGAIAGLFALYGAAVYFVGKPESGVYEAALNQFPHTIKPEQILMVGDTPETDIRGARRLGLSTALVCETGIMAHRLQGKDKNCIFKEFLGTDEPDCLIERFTLQ